MEASAVHLKYSGQGFAHDAIALWALAKPISVLPHHLHQGDLHDRLPSSWMVVGLTNPPAPHPNLNL